DRFEHLRVIQERGFAEVRLELMHKENQAARAVNEGHPSLGLDLQGRGLASWIANVRALEAIPNNLFAAAPLYKPLNALSHQPKFISHFRAVMDYWIDIDRNK